jgi:hypothetical protein
MTGRLPGVRSNDNFMATGRRVRPEGAQTCAPHKAAMVADVADDAEGTCLAG